MNRKIVLAFPRVNVLGRALAWLCSWFVPVLVTSKAKSSVHGAPIVLRFRGRVQNYVSGYNEKLVIEDTGWRFFNRRFRRLGIPKFRFNTAGLEIDYAPCLLKAICNELNSLVGFRVAARRLGLNRPVYLGRWLSPVAERATARLPWALRGLLGFRQWLGEMRAALGALTLEVGRISLALFRPKRDGQSIQTLWLGIGTNEYGRLGKKRSFYWPERLSPGIDLGILYVLPRVPTPSFQSVLLEDRVQWVSQFHLFQYCRKSELLTAAMKIFWTACTMVAPWRGSYRWRARLCGLHFEALAWSMFVKEVPVKLALTTASNWRSTRPILVALKHAGVKTALWHYSANSVRFHHPGGRRNSNGRFKAFHEADRIYVWNPQAERWIHRYLSYSVENQMRVVGPVMCGDAGLCCRAQSHRDDRLRVSIFDVSMPEGGSNSRTGSLHLPEAFYSTFWSDVHRLAHEFSDWVLLLKPKKSLQSSRRSTSDEFQKLFNDQILKQAGRIETIDADADPYMAISWCDAAIVMPFTSPGQAVMHFGRSGFYYDPTGTVGLHHHGDLGRFFCRSYDELAGLIREAAENKRSGGPSLLPERVASFTGAVPQSDPQEVFLRDLAEWIHMPATISPNHTAQPSTRELVNA